MNPVRTTLYPVERFVTSLWISRLLVPGGTAARAVDHGLSWGIPLMSEETLMELSEVLSRTRFDRCVSDPDFTWLIP